MYIGKPGVKYGVVIADPPWQYKSPSALDISNPLIDGSRRSISVSLQNHYPTMRLDDIKNLQVPSAKEALLFLWITNPMLADGVGTDVVRAWGFTPTSVITWAKTNSVNDGVGFFEIPMVPSMKVGHWFRSASEHVIFAVKGQPKRPENWPAIPTWFSHPRTPHSVKPNVIHEYAEKAMPQGPFLEMFARRAYKGWDVWGNEI